MQCTFELKKITHKDGSISKYYMEVNEEALDKAKSKLEGVQERLHLKDQSVVVVALLLRISATLLTITSKKLLHNTLHI